MIKPKRTLLAMLACTLGRPRTRGFVFVAFFLLVLPLFSYTRAFLPASLTRVGLGTQTAYAATSDNLNFQARLETSAGAIAADGYYNVELKLYSALTSSGSSQGSCTGDSNCLWTETRTGANKVRVVNGYLTVNLGDVTAFPSTMPWDQQLYLTMNIGGTGSPSWDGEMSPRLSLTAVPYAFNAKTASQLVATSGANLASLSIAAPTSGNQTFTIQDQGAAGNYNILTQNQINAGFIQNQNAGVQATSNFWISGTGRADTAFQAPLFDSGTAAALGIGTTNATSISIGKTTITTTVQGPFVANGSQFTNNGSTLLTGTTLTDFAASGPIGTAAATVDILTTFVIPQTTAGRTLSLPTPTAGTAGRLAYVLNTGSTAFTMHGVSIQNGKAQTYIYDGSAWTATNIDGAGNGVTFIGTLDSQTKSGDGAVVSGNGIYLQTADGTNPGIVSTGLQTFGGDKTFSGLITGSAGASVSGATINLNTSSNFDTNINTGTSTGAVSIGNSAAGNINVQSGGTIDLTGTTNINTTGAATTTIGNASATNNITGTNTILGATSVNTSGTANTNINTGTNTGNTNIGNTTGTTSITGSTNTVLGTTNVNTTGTAATNIGSATAGAVTITSNAASSFTTNTGALTLTSAAAATWGTNAGLLTLQGAGGATVTSSAGATTSGVTISTGNASAGASGNISIDTGTATTTAGTVTIGTTNASGVTIGRATTTTTIQGNTAVTLSATTGTTMVCRNGSGILSSCDATFLTPTTANFIQNQNASAQTAANFWISGTGRADTSILTPTLDTATATALNIGTTNATSITIGNGSTTGVTITPATTINNTLTVNGNSTALLSVKNGATGLLTADTTNGIVIVGSSAAGACTGSGLGKLCVGQVQSSGGTNASNIYTVNGAATGVTANGQKILVSDTSSGAGNTTNGLIVDNTGTTNAGTTVNGIVVKALNANAGNLINLQGGAAGGKTAFSVTNAGVVGIGSPYNATTGITGQLAFYYGTGSGNTGGVILQTAAQGANTYTLTIPVLSGNATICTDNSTTACGNFIQNQNAAQQVTSNFWISGTGRADTSVLTPLLDTATAVALNIGTTNATQINLNKNTVVTGATGSAALTINQAGSSNILNLQHAGGTEVLTVANGGAVAINVETASNSDFSVKSQGGTYLFNFDTTNAYTVDNGTTMPGNLLENPGFETNANFGFNGWGANVVANGEIEAANPRTGTKNAALVGNGTANTIKTSKKYLATQGDVFYLEGWEKIASGTNGTGRLALMFYDASNTLQQTSSATLADTTTYTKASVTATAPANTAYVLVNMGSLSSSTTGTRYFDDIYFAKVSQPMGITIQNTTGGSTVFSVDSTTGAIQGASLDTTSSAVLTLGASNASRVQIGSSTTDATAKVFVLDSYNNGTDPTGYNGAMYYNTNTNKFRCYENGAWANCAASAANVIQNQNASAQTTANFWISGTGRADTAFTTPSLRAATDGTTAIRLQNNAGSITALVVDTTNTRVGIGAGTAPTATLQVTGSLTSAGGAISLNDSSNFTVSIGGGSTTSAVTIGNSANTTNLASRTIMVGTSGATNTIQGVTQGTAATAGNQLSIIGSTGNTTGAGGLVVVQGGAATATAGSAGGGVTLAGANGSTTTTGGTGGGITLTAGNAGGTGANAAGSISLTAGASSATGSGAAGTISLQGGTANATNTAGGAITITGGTGNGTQSGGAITITGGTGGATSGNGGTLALSGGTGGGAGVMGLVTLNPTAFTGTSQNCTVASCSITAATVNANSTALVNNTYAGSTVTLADPTITTAGRVMYVTNSGTQDMTLSVNGGGQGNTIALKPNTTATMFWNGADWTAAGASSATDLQAAYNNTQTAAGGAEIVLRSTSDSPAGTGGLTVRNNSSVPISGGLLEIQTSIGTNLFSVNSYGTELAANGGAETAGGSSTTFPSNTWSAQSAATVTRTITSGEYQTGEAGVKVVTGASNLHGVRNQLTGNPAVSTTYTVSFTAASSTAGQNTTPIEVIYSHDNGTTLTNVCQGFGGGYTTSRPISNSTNYNWTKVTCTVTTTAAAVTTPLLIIRQTDSTARTIYIDNLSFIRNDSTTRPANVQMGGGNTGGQVTLFTLDRSSTAPLVSNGDDRYIGSMYYDTTLGNIQCYEADGWGACGSAPDNIITFTPEYTGAVLNGTGVGTMTADFCGNGGGLSVNTGFCASGEARNYYKWTSPQASPQTYSIYVAYKLPSTFKQFVSGTTSLTGLVDSTTNAGVTYSIFRKASAGGLTSCSASKTVVGSGTGSANTWTTAAPTTDPNSCTSFAAGDTVIVQINVTAQSNAAAYVENLTFRYQNN